MKKAFFLIIFTLSFLFAKEQMLSIQIQGLKGELKEELLDSIGAKDKNFFSLFNNKKVLSKKFIATLRPTIKGFLEAQGYYDYKVNIAQGKKKIVIKINKGKPIKVSKITIESNFPIKKLISFKKGDVFSSIKFSSIKEDIINRLLENGYCHYQLNSKAFVDLEKKVAALFYKLKKGPLCQFGSIIIEKKPKDIDKKIILSRLQFKSDEKFNIKKIEQSYKALNALNVFSDINIAYEINKNSLKVPIKIAVTKKEKLKRYLLAIGADSEIGFRFRGLWEKRNFLGNAKKFGVETKLSVKEQALTFSYFIPAFFYYKHNFLDFYLNSGIDLKKEDAYKSRSFFINGYFNYQKEYLNVKAGIGIENLDIKLKVAHVSYLLGGVYNLFYPYIEAIYDRRDSKIDPKNGYYLRAYSEYGLAINKKGSQYFKYLLEGRYIKTFKKVTLAAVAKVGSIHIMHGSLPASKLFYGGGLFSNRAYGKDDIGVVTSSKSFEDIGGKSFVNLQLEANFPLYKKLYGAIFFDSTMISKYEYNFHGDRIDSVGFGLRYKTPIGPVKIDVGFNIHKRKDYAISIMLGQSF